MKKKIFTLVLIVAIENLNAFSVNDFVSDTVGDITDGLTSQLGLPSFSVKCDIGVKNINLFDVCGIADKLSLDLGRSFSIGGCTIKTADPLSCQRNALKSFCQDRKKYFGTAAKSYKASVMDSVMSSGEELIGTGGKIIGDFSNCNYVEDTFSNKKMSSGRTLEQIYKDSSFKKLKKHGIFDTITKDIRDCMKASKNKANCLKTENWKLPANIEEVEEDISKTTKQATPTYSSYIKGALETESQMAKAMNKECSQDENPSRCIERVLKNKGEHAKKRDAAIASIETSSAIRKKVAEKATQLSKGIVYRGSEIPNRLPIEMRSAYTSAAQRANASDIVAENLFSTNTSLQKEAVIVLDNKMVDASEPFMTKASVKKIKSLMD